MRRLHEWDCWQAVNNAVCVVTYPGVGSLMNDINVVVDVVSRIESREGTV